MRLYILTPLQSASLIVAFGLIVQGYSVWKLRSALDWRKLWPFVLGAALGVPAGVTLLTWSDPRSIRIAVGVFLVLYSLYAFFRPALKPVTAGGNAADAAVGFANGVLAGLTGLAGILVTIWSGLRGWPKEAQRAVFQPVAVAIFLMSGIVAWRQGNDHGRNRQAVRAGLALSHRGDMAWFQTVRAHRRCDFPENRAGAVVCVGRRADFLKPQGMLTGTNL